LKSILHPQLASVSTVVLQQGRDWVTQGCTISWSPQRLGSRAEISCFVIVGYFQYPLLFLYT
jgi:hypothetical protein